ncbi:conserved hypothetical protein [Neospora caninum Liverpool]|uniref:Uncharacterized protein n=1 Tax=Neospora caninum (strain Liverpool) TaxID=572307 RepID=F0VCQ8_NEOCL|nr:conserved hypothetical protein [Neospora caninum Liverpool]CBZ51747.1 conserved hypothetical protein [Neospora caninum Liverpool]|eukprot:XP_003881780.1 conserved hypothetical protein [Neospora caninum Liverpool]
MRWVSSTGAGILSFYSLGDGVQHVLPYLAEEVKEEEASASYRPKPAATADEIASFTAHRHSPSASPQACSGHSTSRLQPVQPPSHDDTRPPWEEGNAFSPARPNAACAEPPGDAGTLGSRGSARNWGDAPVSAATEHVNVQKTSSLGYITACIFSGGWGGYDESEVTFGTTEEDRPSVAAASGECSCAAVRQFFSSDRLLLALDKGGNGVVSHWSSVGAEEGDASGGSQESPAGDGDCPPSSFFSLNLPIHRSESNPIITPLLSVVPATTGNTRLLSVYDLVTSSFVFYARPPAGEPTDCETRSAWSSVSPARLTPNYASFPDVPLDPAGSPDVVREWNVGSRKRKMWMHAAGGSWGRARAYACSAALPVTSPLCISGTAWLPNLHPLLLAASSTDGMLLFYDLRASPHPFFVAQRPESASWASSVASSTSTGHSGSRRRNLNPTSPPNGSAPGKHASADASPNWLPSSGGATSPASSAASAQARPSRQHARPFSFLTTVPWLTSASVPHDGVILPCVCGCCRGRAASLQGSDAGESPLCSLASSSSLGTGQSQVDTNQEGRAHQKTEGGRRTVGDRDGEPPHPTVREEQKGGLGQRRGSTPSFSADPLAGEGEQGKGQEQGRGDCLEGVESPMAGPSEPLFRQGAESVSIFTGCDASIVLKPRNCRRPRPTKRKRSDLPADPASGPREPSSLLGPAPRTCSVPLGEEESRRETRRDSASPNSRADPASGDERGDARRSRADGSAEANGIQETGPQKKSNDRRGHSSLAARTSSMAANGGLTLRLRLSPSSQTPRNVEGSVEEQHRVATGQRKTSSPGPVTERRKGGKGWKTRWFSQEQRLFMRFATKDILSQRKREPCSCVPSLTANSPGAAVAPDPSPAVSGLCGRLPLNSTEKGSEEEREEQAGLARRSETSSLSSCERDPHRRSSAQPAVCSSVSGSPLDDVLLPGLCPVSTKRPGPRVSLLDLAADLLRISSSPSSVFTSFPSWHISLPPLSQPRGEASRLMASLDSDCSAVSAISHTNGARSLAHAHLCMAAASALSGLLLSHRFDQHLVLSQLASHQQRQLLKLLHSRLPHASRPLTQEMADDVARSLSRLHSLLEGKETPSDARGDEAPASSSVETELEASQTPSTADAPRSTKKRKQETSHVPVRRKAGSGAGPEPDAPLLRSSDATGFQDSSHTANAGENANGVSPALVSSILRLYTQLFLASTVSGVGDERPTPKGDTRSARGGAGEQAPLSLVLPESVTGDLWGEALPSPLKRGQTYFVQNLLLRHYRNVIQVLRYAASALFVFGDTPCLLEPPADAPLSAAVKTIRAASLACSPCPSVAKDSFCHATKAEQQGQSPCRTTEAGPTEHRGSCDSKTKWPSTVGPDFRCGVCASVESFVKVKMRRWLQEELQHDFARVMRHEETGRRQGAGRSTNRSRFSRDRHEHRLKMREIRTLAKSAVASLCLCELFLPASFFPSVLFNIFRTSGLSEMTAIQRNCMRVLPISDSAFHTLARAQDLCVRQKGTPSLSVPLLASIQDRRLVASECGRQERLSSLTSSAYPHGRPSSVASAAALGSEMLSDSDFQNASQKEGCVSHPSLQGSVEERSVVNQKKGQSAPFVPQSGLGGATACSTEDEAERKTVKAETRRQQLFCVDALGRASVLTVSLLLVPSRILERRSDCTERTRIRDGIRALDLRPEHRSGGMDSETICNQVGKLLTADAEREAEDDGQGDARIILCPSVDAKNDGLLERALLKEKCGACCGLASGNGEFTRPPRPRGPVAQAGNEEHTCSRQVADSPKKGTAPEEDPRSETGTASGGTNSRNRNGRKGKLQERRTPKGQKRRRAGTADATSTSPQGNLWDTEKSKEKSCEKTANAFLDRLPILPAWRFPPRSVDSNASFLMSTPSSTELTTPCTTNSTPGDSHAGSSLPTTSLSTSLPSPQPSGSKPLLAFALPDAPGGPRPPPPLLLSAAPILPSHPSPPFLPHAMARPFSVTSLAPLYAGSFAAGTVYGRKAAVHMKVPSGGVSALGGRKGRDERRETVFSDWLTEDEDDDLPSDDEDDEETRGSG